MKNNLKHQKVTGINNLGQLFIFALFLGLAVTSFSSQADTCTPTSSTEGTVADGEDNNCNGLIDEGLPTNCVPGKDFYVCGQSEGACEQGAQNCVYDSHNPSITYYNTTCEGMVGPKKEECNGIDDDCDGLIDEGFTEDQCCTSGTTRVMPGICADGQETCNDSHAWVVTTEPDNETNACGSCGAAPVEICDNFDNDCDGFVNEGFTADECCVSGTTRPISGACAEGVETCDINHAWVVTTEPNNSLNACGECGAIPIEICDGDDNDCDGAIDEGVKNACGTCGTLSAEPNTDCTTDEMRARCATAKYSCMVSGSVACVETAGEDLDSDGIADACETVPADEVCDLDGIQEGDEECDGSAPEGFTCDENCKLVEEEVCETDVQQRCVVSDPAGQPLLGVCANGWQKCIDNVWGTCVANIQPRAEICDNRDNDCNGEVDDVVDKDGDGFTCNDCNDEDATVYPDADEICDGQDNDCNPKTRADEGCVCRENSTVFFGSDVGSCAPEKQVCQNNAWVVTDEGKGPIAEECNGLDDDCDGLVDEDFDEDGDGFISCIDDCNDLDPTINPDATEICNEIDDDCNDVVDDDAICATAEICDGVDNDLNGEIDEALDCDAESPSSLLQGAPDEAGGVITTFIPGSYSVTGGGIMSCSLDMTFAATRDPISALWGFAGFAGLWILRKVIGK